MTVRALEAGTYADGVRLTVGTSLPLLVVLTGLTLVTGAVVHVGWLAQGALRVAAVAAAHAGMIALAMGSGGIGRRTATSPFIPGFVLFLLLAVAEAATLVDHRLCFAFLAPPVWLLALRAAGHLEGLGLSALPRPHVLVLGAVIGLLLGGHLVFSAWTTLGYHVRHDAALAYVAALAYDVGANIPSGELLFRGALLNRLQRRWAFAPAALVTTAAWLLRYLVDPRLPAAPEALAGAIVYLSVLGGTNAWLFARSGSVLPGMLASLAFFAAYRLLALP